jgi:biopolymer transport protein ExbD
VDAKNGFWVNGVQVEKNDLGNRVKSVLEEKTERIVLIKGDTDASYSSIMYAMDDLRKVGVENIGLITEPKTPVNPNVGGK